MSTMTCTGPQFGSPDWRKHLMKQTKDVIIDLYDHSVVVLKGENRRLRALIAALDERKNAERHLARTEDLDGYRAFVGRGRATKVRDAKARLRKANKAVTATRKSVEASE